MATTGPVNNQGGPGASESDEVRIELRPVIKLAAWAYEHHRSSGEQRLCPVCGAEGCDPYRWADEILTAVAAVPIYVIKRTGR
jgi:hypothetical protein